ncbi:MAG: hypothetical protein R3C03_08790 [Pirellulaceae bacterium]
MEGSDERKQTEYQAFLDEHGEAFYQSLVLGLQRLDPAQPESNETYLALQRLAETVRPIHTS